ncbi:glycosyltransferase family 2 protein [Pelagicoccus albus]|uniref:Glycosyltransferase family 2 protein n=1 Tax=Pelagicoccus albus TaxID=415222 RepID=A0A7X1B5N4_9BACT|nr:glycosyltransferase family 2 protein [Pelagicoccus albus]MBC2605987.1 glycosyltransferase family 2 protein [Pelagicoccus albus]
MPTLSIIIPVFNEFGTLEQVLDSVENCGLQDYQLIVVDDCSTDGTRDLIKDKLASRIDVVVFHDSNKGKGGAIRTGFEAAKGDYVVIQDADLEYDPKELPKLLAAILAGEADVIYGTRFPKGEAFDVTPTWHRAVNRALTHYSNFFTGLRITDMETCYKMFPTPLIQSIELEELRFGIEPEMTAKIADLGVSFLDVPITYNRRTYEEGKKIGAMDGLRALYVITKYGLRSIFLP